MEGHVDELLASARDERLSIVARDQVRRHLSICLRCRELDAELSAADERLKAFHTGSAMAVPPLSTLASAFGHEGPLRALGVVAVLVVAVTIGSLLSERGAGPAGSNAGLPSSPRPTVVATATASPSDSKEPPVSVLVVRPKVLDQIPGGGSVVTSAFDRLEVRSLTGDLILAHRIDGIGVGSPSFDGASRVAYWRKTSMGDPRWDLMVWDTRSRTSRSLLTLNSGRPEGPVWSAERDRLVFAIRGEQGGGARLVIADVASGRLTDLLRRSTVPSPVYADQGIVVGVAGQAYEVFRVDDGSVVNKTTIKSYGAMGASRDGVLFGLTTRFEAPSGPLELWNAEEPSRPIASVPNRGLDAPIFRPSSTEVVFTTGKDLRALDYRSAVVRTLFSASGDGTAVAVAFDETGRYLLVRDAAGLELYEAQGGSFDRIGSAQIQLDAGAQVFGVILR